MLIYYPNFLLWKNKKNKMKNYLNRNNLNKLPRLSTNSKLESIKQNNYYLFNCDSNFQINHQNFAFQSYE